MRMLSVLRFTFTKETKFVVAFVFLYIMSHCHLYPYWNSMEKSVNLITLSLGSISEHTGMLYPPSTQSINLHWPIRLTLQNLQV